MHVKFVQLSVHDQERAIAFYTDLLGMHVAKDAAYGEGWRWVELAMPPSPTRIVFSQATTTERSEKPDLVLVTDEIQVLHDRLRQAEVEILQPPKAAPWNSNELSMQLLDSEDNFVLVTQDTES